MAAPIIIPMSCRRPAWKGQAVIDDNAFIRLDKEGNVLIVINNALDRKTVAEYTKCAVAVPRTRGISVFQKPKPRYEVFYSPTGTPYRYSHVTHETTTYPHHVQTIIQQLEDVIASQGYDDMPHFGELDITGDILYDASIPCGGGVGSHRDNERVWPIVIIYSLGQTRYLRVKDTHDGTMRNIAMTHNSVVVMAGPTFQQRYMHQVDKLHEEEDVGARLSLNIRYLAPKQTKKRRTE